MNAPAFTVHGSTAWWTGAVARARRILAAIERMTVLQWAERYRRWPDGSLYDSSLTPHVRTILEAYSDPGVEEITVIKPSQSGATEGALLNIIGYHMHLDPRHILAVIPSVDEAEKWSKKKLQPMVDDTPELQGRLEDGSRKKSNTILEKALALDTQLATPTGWTTMGAITIGDRVFDELGNPCSVTHVTEVMDKQECYRVTFSDGSSIVADAGHSWSVEWWKVVDGKQCRVAGIRKTHEIAKGVRLSQRFKYSVRSTAPLRLDETSPPVDPYVLGVWLGDGLSHRPAITIGAHDSEEFSGLLRECGVTVECRRARAGTVLLVMDPRSVRRNRSGQYGRVPGTVSDGLASLSLLSKSGDGNSRKRIPPIYLRASADQRLALLQGLMDTDGHIGKDGRQASIDTVLPCLADGIEELLVSLGLTPRRSTRHGYYRKEDGRRVRCRDVVRLSFAVRPGLSIFRLTRKSARQLESPRQWSGRADRRRIVAVGRVPSVPVRCITVDSPSHLYLAGRSMIRTHNSYAGGSIGIVGSNSGRGFRMVTIGTVLSDDVDGWDDTAGSGAKNEGDQVTLIRRRTDRVPDRKLVWISTPTYVLRRIHSLYGGMERRGRLHVPCPHCGAMQVLRWGGPDTPFGIRWEQEEVGEDYRLQPGEIRRAGTVHRPRTAYYVCAANGCVIEESAKPAMEAAGVYLVEKPLKPGTDTTSVYQPGDDLDPVLLPGTRTVGLWFNGITITLPGSEWGRLVAEFLNVKNDPDALRAFFNLVLAEPWEDRHSDIDPTSLHARLASYPAEVPEGVGILTGMVDVQGNRLEMQVVGWGVREQAWALAHWRIYGDPEQDAGVWSTLEALRNRPWKTASGGTMYLSVLGIDEGYLTPRVHDFVRGKELAGVYAFDGVGGHRDYSLRRLKKPNRRGVRPWKVAVDRLKDVYFRRLQIQRPGPGCMHFVKPPEVAASDGIVVASGFDADYFAQLVSEEAHWSRSGGGVHRTYRKIKAGAANEALDLWIGNMAALHTVPQISERLPQLVTEAAKGQAAVARPRRKKLRMAPRSGGVL